MGFLANYVRNLASIAAFRQPKRPLLFSYYVTHRCPLACRYCSDGQGRPFKDDIVDELSTGEAKELISLLRRDGDTLDITGGEPMLRVDLEDLLAHARQIGFRTILNTKGLGLARRPDVMRLSNVLVLSVDSLHAGPLARITGSTTEAAAGIIETLRWIIQNGRRHQTRVVLSVVAMPDSLDDVSEVFGFSIQQRLGFQLSPEIVGTQVHPELRDNERFRSLVNEVIKAKSGGAGVLGVSYYLRGIRDCRSYTCHPLLMPTIRPDGTVNLPCLERPRERVDLKTADRYGEVLTRARIARTSARDCRGKCHIFCHMALSLLQQHPLAALGELRAWRCPSC